MVTKDSLFPQEEWVWSATRRYSSWSCEVALAAEVLRADVSTSSYPVLVDGMLGL